MSVHACRIIYMESIGKEEKMDAKKTEPVEMSREDIINFFYRQNAKLGEVDQKYIGRIAKDGLFTITLPAGINPEHPNCFTSF